MGFISRVCFKTNQFNNRNRRNAKLHQPCQIRMASHSSYMYICTWRSGHCIVCYRLPCIFVLQLSVGFLGVLDNLLLVDQEEFKESNEEAKTSGRLLAVWSTYSLVGVCYRHPLLSTRLHVVVSFNLIIFLVLFSCLSAFSLTFLLLTYFLSFCLPFSLFCSP